MYLRETASAAQSKGKSEVFSRAGECAQELS